MADRQAAAPTQGGPAPADLLRAALEKIVFFEWRLSELAAELSAAQSRCASAELERSRAEDEARAADQRARSARLQLAELEAERSRLASLLAQPARTQLADPYALEAERSRAARLQSELDDARRQLEAGRAERERWLSEMIEQARGGDEAPAALAQFISELRGEILTLRDHQKRCEELLAGAGIAPPAVQLSQPPSAPPREPQPVEQARQLWAEGRIGSAPDVQLPPPAPAAATTSHFATPAPPREVPGGIAARALAAQCLRQLATSDSSRREQAARHLAAVPVPSAAPALASALGAEADPRARAQIARALVACGGEGAADLVARLQTAGEPPLVRLAAAEALSALPSRIGPALETAARDPAPAVRRRAAALAAAEGVDALLTLLSHDPDASVRAACDAARREAPAPAPNAAAPAPAARAAAPSPAPARAAPKPLPRDPARAALLVLAGANGGAR